MTINLTYMSGAGNTFTVIDNRIYQLRDDYWSNLAHILCHKNDYNQFSTEGLIVLNESEKYDFNVSFFNPDGSQGMMCGNGGRCALMFADHESFINQSRKKRKFIFRMVGGTYSGLFSNDKIRLFLPPPIQISENVTMTTPKFILNGTYINVNSDHFCINYLDHPELKEKKFREFCIDTYAPEIRFNNTFYPNGVNVNFYKIVSRKKIDLRTYERGVEAETGACGTGALSTALSTLIRGLIDLPVTIVPPSKSPLIVDINGKFPNNIKNLILEGNAEIKLQTQINLPDNLFKYKVESND